MDKDRSHMTEKILNLTLEILCLLTGEDYEVVKKTSYERFTPTILSNEHSVPPPHSLKSARNENNIVEVTSEATGPLTGEVPIRCQDVSVYFSMEEWGYLEGHRDLYKDVVMENEPPLTSPDGSSKRNPPERCPRPLYSRDPTQEDLTIPRHDQNVNVSDHNIAIKQEFTMDDEEYGVTKELFEGHKDQYKNIVMEPPSNRNPAERCPRPLYSRDSTQKDLTIPHHDQHEGRMKIKTEVKEKEEGTSMMGFQQTTQEVGMEATIQQKESSQYISSAGGHYVPQNLEGHFILSVDSNVEDTGLAHYSPGVNPVTDCMHLKYYPEISTETSHLEELIDKSRTTAPMIHPDRVERRPDPSDPKEPFFALDIVPQKGREIFRCSKCDRTFTSKSSLVGHQRAHAKKVLLLCFQCRKSFTRKSELIRHERRHTGERPYSCLECEKSYFEKFELVRHQSFHTGVRPHPCTQCDRSFAHRKSLENHMKCHVSAKL